MASLTDLRDAIKNRYRLTNGDLNEIIDSYSNQAYRKYARRFGWAQTLVENFQITLTAGTEQYDLPSDFWRLNPNSVRYNVLSNDQGTKIRVLGMDELVTYKLLDQVSQPWGCAIVSGTGQGRRLEFVPSFTDTNIIVELDYYRTPTELTEDVDDPTINEIQDVIIYDALVSLAMYHGKPEDAQMFRQELKEQLMVAIQTVVS